MNIVIQWVILHHTHDNYPILDLTERTDSFLISILAINKKTGVANVSDNSQEDDTLDKDTHISEEKQGNSSIKPCMLLKNTTVSHMKHNVVNRYTHRLIT